MLRLTRLGPRAAVAGPAMAEEAKGAADRLAQNMAAAEAVNIVAAEIMAENMVAAAVMATNRRWRKNAMLQPIDGNRRSTIGWLALRVLWVSLVLGLGSAQTALAQAPGRKTFNSATEATDAFATAVQTHDDAAMLAILGPSGRDLISSGDRVADQNNQDTFATKYRASHQFLAAGDGRTFLYIGPENWPTPIPLLKNGSQWYFDTDYGKQEILYRRIGSNELNVIKVSAAIADAQKDYYAGLHDGASVHQYAQKFRSTPGTQDGLFWEVKAGAQPESPLGPLVAEAAGEGYQHHAAAAPAPHPFHGYIYRILTSQGAAAPGGARNYIVDGKMTGGFALVAYPVSYRDSGVMTFIVNQDGQVYQKDLGPDTEQIAGEMMTYDPDATWEAVNKATVAELKRKGPPDGGPSTFANRNKSTERSEDIVADLAALQIAQHHHRHLIGLEASRGQLDHLVVGYRLDALR